MVDYSNFDIIEWGDTINMTPNQWESYYTQGLLKPGTSRESTDYNTYTDSISGIFGMPYQFSTIVDPTIETTKTSNSKENPNKSCIGRKFSEKIFSVMPILFLTPGEPKFMDEQSKSAKARMAGSLAGVLGDGDGVDAPFDEGRYYSFQQNFPEYKRYANVALRTLAIFMGIGDVEIPVPGKHSKPEKLSNIDIEHFMNTDFTKLFGTQCTVPFYIDADNSISESFSNSTTDSMLAQTVNGFSQSAKEIQFLMGSGDTSSVMKSIGMAAADVGKNLSEGMGELSEIVAGRNMLSRVTKELTTIVSGGKIVFPEIWSESEYDKNYDITIKLRSPDPDPVSIFLNVYMPIILLISMAAPHQMGNSSNSYESPFLVRASYKSIFNCDLGIISSLSITKGGDGGWNILGQPTSADVTVSIKDLYSSMFISKRMGIISNTAQMDYLATLAGIDMNEYEPRRIANLYLQLLADTPRDWADHGFGKVKRELNKIGSKVLGTFSDTRYLGS